ncbi:MAG: excinuclease ABC subunit A, partial [Paraglaciecola sp.]
TGLHYFDIVRLLGVFQSLVDRGDSILFIEHNSTLIGSANEVITLGPGSGDRGGTVEKATRRSPD